jgi:hypothetical protein
MDSKPEPLTSKNQLSLVTRLRESCECAVYRDCRFCAAADAIERLTRERDAARKFAQINADAVDALQADRERLRADRQHCSELADAVMNERDRLRAALERIAGMEYGLTHAMDFASCRSIAVQALSAAPAAARSTTDALSNERVSTATAGAVSETLPVTLSCGHPYQQRSPRVGDDVTCPHCEALSTIVAVK